MSHFTRPQDARKVTPYRPPTIQVARRQAGLFGDDPPAPAARLAAAPRPVVLPFVRPTAPGVPIIDLDGSLYELRIVDDPGNQFTGPMRVFDFHAAGTPHYEVAARVVDYERKGPVCWCRGLPHRDCPHVWALLRDGYVEGPEDLDLALTIAPGGEGGEP
jgi:hypothetical protein